MRCTKCSFISFDDLLTCAKCANDLSRLSKDLNGTCIETRQEFFLGSAIQTAGMDEDNFSDSQMLPPIDHSAMNFDDTSTGGFSPLAATSQDSASFGFDDSVGVSAEDDISIELGDIMPIDLEQLDSTSVLSEGVMDRTDTLPIDDFNFKSDFNANISTSSEKKIDFDFTADIDDSSSDLDLDDDISDINLDHQYLDLHPPQDSVVSFDTTSDDVTAPLVDDSGLDIDFDLSEHLADVDGSFDKTISLNSTSDFDATKISLNTDIGDGSGSLELDESLVAELADTSTLDGSGEFPVNFSIDPSSSGDFELDEALVAELASGDVLAVESVDGVHSLAEASSVAVSGLSVDESLPLAQFEDLTGDFPTFREDDDAELVGLDLADIDVSDLVDSSAPLSNSVDEIVSSSLSPNDTMPNSAQEFFSSNDTLGNDSVGNNFQVQRQFDDSVELEFDPNSVGIELTGNVDDLIESSSNSKDYSEGIVLGSDAIDQGLSPFDDTVFDSSASLNFARESAENDLSIGGGAIDDELSLDHLVDDEGALTDGIDALALDADFEAFLSKAPGEDNLPEIELVADDDDIPPDLPT